MVAVAPALVVASATRVQARRVELATQAAQTYIDALRAGKIPPPPYGVILKQDQTNNFNKNWLDGYPAPQGGRLTCPSTPAPVGTQPIRANLAQFYCKDASSNPDPELYCVEFDRDAGCTKGDYIVQGFRSFLPNSTNPALPDTSDVEGTQGYMLGVRVYRQDAMTFNGALQTTVARGNKKVAAYTGGAGDRTAPLVEMTTAIRTDKTTYDSLKQRLGVKSDTTTTTPSPSP